MNLATFEGLVEGVDSEAGHQVYADSQLDDDKWKHGDRDDDLITFAFNHTPGLRVPAPDNADVFH